MKNETQKILDTMRKAGHPSTLCWAVAASNKLNGKTIKRVGYLTSGECENFGWDETGPVIQFTDGSYLVASRDDEGNGPGALFTSFDDLPTIPTIRGGS